MDIIRPIKKIEIDRPHTQNSVVVYVNNEEKEEIKEMAKSRKTSMSNYLLQLHKKEYENE